MIHFFQRNNLRLDMNIEGAWKQGITGKGVKVTILDDGGYVTEAVTLYSAEMTDIKLSTRLK